MSENYTRKPNTKCSICDKLVYKRPSQIKRGVERIFCSMACYGVSCRKEIPCVVCEKLILSGKNRRTCSRSCANINRAGIRYKINSPRDKAKSQKTLKIRLLSTRERKCERCSYENYHILQVHHKDRNRNNNSINNLELICPNCHCEEHYGQKAIQGVLLTKSGMGVGVV